MIAESEYVSIPMRLTVGSVSFPSTSREFISSSRNWVISWTFCIPMLPDESRANTTSEPSRQAANNTHTAGTDAENDKTMIPMITTYFTVDMIISLNGNCLHCYCQLFVAFFDRTVVGY